MLRLHLALSVAAVVLSQDIVHIKQGRLQGHRLISRKGRQIFAFQGIPYAKPPLGELRFKPPQTPEAWTGVLNATKDGPECLQKQLFVADPEVKGQEDCLYLNVYTPWLPENDLDFKLLDVMFWIHGGGWISGSGGTDLYGPQYLLDKDVLLVTINYRLGPLGFLSTSDSECPGNNGLKDQVAALRWVRDNIAVFGGNPSSVTIFGESAGGASVHHLMLSDVSQGLFHRAISQSGTAICPWALTTQGTKEQTYMLAKQLGCSEGSSADLLSCLRSQDAHDITDTLRTFKAGDTNSSIPYGPVLEIDNGEDAFITKEPLEAFTKKQQFLVPWMVGFLSGDGAIIASALFSKEGVVEEVDEAFEDIIPTTFLFRDKGDAVEVRKMAREIRKYYFGDQPISPETAKEAVDMYTDALLFHGTDMAVRLHAQKDATVYYYYFDYRGTNSYSAFYGNSSIDYGVCHFDELMYLFPQDHWFPNSTKSPTDELMVDILTSLWTDFARTGNPTPDAEKFETWLPVSSPEVMEYVHIDDQGLRPGEGLLQERAEFWRNLLRKKTMEKDEL